MHLAREPPFQASNADISDKSAVKPVHHIDGWCATLSLTEICVGHVTEAMSLCATADGWWRPVRQNWLPWLPVCHTGTRLL